MRNGVIVFLLLLVTGCADFRFSDQPSLLYPRKDGPGMPKHLGKQESLVVVNATRPGLALACRDALLILGCTEIHEGDDWFRGDRSFVPGFVCGAGGETLHVTINQLAEDRYAVRVVSYKRFPYPAAPRFLDGDFCNILLQLLDVPQLAKTP